MALLAVCMFYSYGLFIVIAAILNDWQAHQI